MDDRRSELFSSPLDPILNQKGRFAEAGRLFFVEICQKLEYYGDRLSMEDMGRRENDE